ncbi:MAG TPA: hypothetical protein PLW24_23300, partial [Burkholderiaceae bacterium]|nr:hypothetical protein [Burkholderiaceae bacterium]
GLFDNDEFRRHWLVTAAAVAGRPGFSVAADVSVAGRRDAQLDLMADLLAAHLDIDAVLALVDGGGGGGEAVGRIMSRRGLSRRSYFVWK